ncbi:MAG: beta-1,4-galactosyltransferase [Gaiellaceae bacterium]|nr:MAG: beta-1,4-galactosyltransferase [Gaiellaceae bacterium]
MIFVTVGTTHFAFDRLLKAVEELDTDEEIVAQCGSSTVRPRNATCVELMDYGEVAAHMERARIVVSHAGVGSILTATLAGKRPLVVARRARLGEAVDDHQLELADALHELGSVTHVRSLDELAESVRHSDTTAFTLAADTSLSRAVAEITQSALLGADHVCQSTR